MNAAPGSRADTPLSRSDEVVLLDWRVHLMRRSPRKALLVAAVALLALFAGVLLFASLLFGLLGAALVFTSTAEFLLPIRYRLTERRASASCGLSRFEIPWERVRCVGEQANSVTLSPVARGSKLEPFRGVMLRFEGNRDEVMRIVRERHQGEV